MRFIKQFVTKKLPSVVAIIFFLSSCAPRQSIFHKDLDFIHDAISNNHPGVYNELDPDFNQNLERFYKRAKSKIDHSNDPEIAIAAIDEFASSFEDPHLRVYWFGAQSNQKNVYPPSNFTLEKISSNAVWVKVPTFSLNLPQEKEFQRFLKNVSKLPKKEYYVLDLRGNSGGNSFYGSQLIYSIFGEEYTRQKKCPYDKKMIVDWRASKSNLKHVLSLIERYPDYAELRNVAYGLKKSIDLSHPLYGEYCGRECKIKNQIEPNNHKDIKIIVVIDSKNVSAALDFIDELKMVASKVVLVGQTTKADRLYIEISPLTLPSGQGKIIVPIKVYRNKLRKDKEPYVPEINFDDIKNTSALKKFILRKIRNKSI